MSTNISIKIISPHGNPAEMAKIMKSQRLLQRCLIPLQSAYEDEDPNSPTYQKLLFKPCDFSANISKETENIRERLQNPDVETAYTECKDAGAQLSFRVDLKTTWHLGDSISIDNCFFDLRKECFLENGYDYKCISLMRGETYLGHVWYYTKKDAPDYCGIYGIKSSVVNLITKKSMGDKCPSYRKGIAYRLLDAVMQVARSENRKKIVVPWPLEAMIYILTKRGFTEIHTRKNTPERQFLQQLTRTSTIYVKEL